MRITIDKLKQIIIEEVQHVLNEQTPQDKCRIKFTAICNKEVAQKREAYDKTKPKDEFGDYPFKPSCKETGGKAPCVDQECVENPELCFKKCFGPKYNKCLKTKAPVDPKVKKRIEKAKKEAEKRAKERAKRDLGKASPPLPPKEKEKESAEDLKVLCRSTKYCRKTYGKEYVCNREFTRKYKGKVHGYCAKSADFS